MKRVLGLGNALVDLLIQMDNDSMINDLELPKGSMTMIEENQAEAIAELVKERNVPKVSGGSAANTIHGIASLGGECGYVGKIKDDEIGDFFKSDLESVGITTQLFNGNSASGCAYTFISTDSERTFATYLGAAVEMSANELTESMFEGYDIVHIEGYLIYNRDLILKAMQLAKKAGLTISLDMASYNVVEDNLEYLQEVVPNYVDIVFANEEEAKAYTKLEPREALDVFASQCEIAVVKIGKEGSLVKKGPEVVEVGIIETTPVDTTGAGDQYAAGFIYGLNQNLDLASCGKIAALLAGTVIAQYGARIEDSKWEPIREKVKTWLN